MEQKSGWKSVGTPYRDGKKYRVEAVCGCGKHGAPICRKDNEPVGACIDCRERRKIKHGHAIHGQTSPTYKIWQSMLGRCENKDDHAYKNYGARGIRVCERWQSFENFLADMGERPPHLSIERTKNNLGYWKSNCIWATRKRQNRNTRRTRYLTHAGETMSASDWADRVGIDVHTILNRIDRAGMSIKAALTTPVGDWVETRRCNNSYATITYKNETLTLPQWAERTSISRATLRQRYFGLGWTPEATLTTPVRKQKK